jgi:hypothetical protein
MEQLQTAAAAASAAAPEVSADEAAEAAVKATLADKDVPKVRPNDPCPCGSGKRYKKCHGQTRDKKGAKEGRKAGVDAESTESGAEDAREEPATT